MEIYSNYLEVLTILEIKINKSIIRHILLYLIEFLLVTSNF
jgi:hypothetical protein